MKRIALWIMSTLSAIDQDVALRSSVVIEVAMFQLPS